MRPFLLVLSLTISCFAIAQQKQQPNSFVRPLPKPAKAVNDYSKFLTASEKQYLEKELTRYYAVSSNAIVIVTLDSLTDKKTKQEYTVEDAAMLYFNTWGIGDPVKNNGVLLMATRKPRKLRITVGRGAESILTDEVCQQIMKEKLIPNFKQGLFFTGFKEAIQSLEEELGQDSLAVTAVADNSTTYASQQPVSGQVNKMESYSTGPGFSFFSTGAIVFIIFVVIIIISAIIRQASGEFTRTGYQHRRSGFGTGYNNSAHHFHNDQANFNNNAWIASGGGMSSSFDSSSSSSSSDSGSSSSSSDSSGGGSSDGGGASGSW